MDVITYTVVLEMLSRARRIAEYLKGDKRPPPKLVSRFCRTVDAMEGFKGPSRYQLLVKQEDGSWKLAESFGIYHDPLSASMDAHEKVGRGDYKVVCVVEV